MSTEAERHAATLKTIQSAIRSFESATGKKPQNATAQDLNAWAAHLSHSGVPIATCRKYHTLILRLAAAKREPTAKRILSVDEIKFMKHVATQEDYAWLVVCLLAGTECLAWTWGTLYNPNVIIPMNAYLLIVDEAQRRGMGTFEYPYRGKEDALWLVDYNPNARIWDLPKHEITRRLKNIAKRAGIAAANMSLATLDDTHKYFAETNGSAEKTAKMIGVRNGSKSNKPVHRERIAQ